MQEPNDKDITKLNTDAKNAYMFKDWLDGMKYTEIAIKYGVHYQTVRKHAQEHEWKKLRKEYRTRLYNDALDGLKDIVSQLQTILSIDVHSLYQQVTKSKRTLTLEERAYISANLDKLLKQINKGNENDASANVGRNASILVKKVTVELPPGTKPESVSALIPAGNVEFVNKDPAKQEKKTTLEDLDSVNEEEVKEEKPSEG